MYSVTPLVLISTEDGVPYIVSIFAENSAGNGTKCNVTDFTNELRKFHCLPFATKTALIMFTYHH